MLRLYTTEWKVWQLIVLSEKHLIPYMLKLGKVIEKLYDKFQNYFVIDRVIFLSFDNSFLKEKL